MIRRPFVHLIFRLEHTMRSPILAVVAAVAIMSSAAPAGAQSASDRIKRVVSQRTDSATDSLALAVIKKVTAAIKCIVTDKRCITKANDAGKPVVVTDKTGAPLPDQQHAAKAAGVKTPAAAAAPAVIPDAVAPSAPTVAASAPSTSADSTSAPPGQGVWLNYDFVPGDRTLFVEDFSGNDVGDFPRRVHLTEGNMEVVKVKGQTMLRGPDGGRFYIVVPERLPSRFTVEMRFHEGHLAGPINMATSEKTYETSASFGCNSNKAFVEVHGSGGGDSGTDFQSDPLPGFVNCTFTIDNGKGIKGYIDEHRTANSPQSHVTLTDTIYFEVHGSDANDPTLIATIRVAAGGKKLYDALAATGRVSTHGILFATGSDQIRPESTPTLKEIGDMLTEHADLKLLIEGHTDNVGSAAANQTLSDKRAAAVTAYLTKTFSIDAARLTSKGFGASKPAGPNTTAEGRQNNRRVELVKKP